MWEQRRETGVARRGLVRPSGAASGSFPSPATRLPPLHGCGSGILPRPPAAAESGDGGREARVGARFARGLANRGWKPLPQSRVREAGVGRRGVVRPSGAAFGSVPPPATRLPHTPTNVGAEAGGERQETRGGAPSGRGLWIFPVSRNPSPVHSTNVGAASCRDRLRRQSRETGVGRRGSVRAPRAALRIGAGSPSQRQVAVYRLRCTVTRLPQPVSRALPRSGRGWKPLPQAGVAGSGGRETRGGAPFGRDLWIFPVSRSPYPVHSRQAGYRSRVTVHSSLYTVTRHLRTDQGSRSATRTGSPPGGAATGRTWSPGPSTHRPP